MPTVSVVLPVYNAEDFIEQSIESILTQTMSDFELIIIANGSNKATLEKIRSFSDPRINLLQLPKPCVVEASNVGICAAWGKYIARMDADDYAHPERLERQAAFLRENSGYDAVSCLVKYEGDSIRNYGYYLHVEWLNSLVDSSGIYENRFVDLPVANPSLMAKREIFDHYGLYQKGDFPEDYELVLRWLERGANIGKVRQFLFHWRDHARRLSRNHEMYSQDAFYRIKTEYFARWFNRHFPGEKEVLIWGTGKSVREKCRFLANWNITVSGYIDVKSSRENQTPPVYHYRSIPNGKFILSYVSDRNGRVAIHNELVKRGLRQGEDFYMMS